MHIFPLPIAWLYRRTTHRDETAPTIVTHFAYNNIWSTHGSFSLPLLRSRNSYGKLLTTTTTTPSYIYTHPENYLNVLTILSLS